MSQPPSTGGKLKGRYLIERELGRGGVGVVYQARDERLHGMPVVIKFLLDASGQNLWLKKKFLQEAEALTRINHPGIVRVIDRDVAEDGRPFFVMEYIEGKPLRQVMQVEGMALEYVALLVSQIGHALYAAHQQGVFHRDLKPENIMLQRLTGGQEQVKLIDFGIAKVLDSQAGEATEVKVIAGSQAYISPEQLLSNPVSAATDIYTFAVIVYEMVTGRLPFSVSAPNYFLAMQQLVKLQEAQAIVKPKTFRPDLPEAAQILMLNAFSFDPVRRPQNAQVFADDLARALRGQIKVTDDRATVPIPSPEPTSRVSASISASSASATTAPEVSPPDISQKIASTAASSGSLKGKSNRVAIFAGLAVLVLIAAVFIAVFFKQSGELKPDSRIPDSTTAVDARVLDYSIFLQKDPQRFPGSKPIQSAGEVIFSPGDRLRFTFSSPQTGHLYIINESTPLDGAAPNYNILFPSPTSNQSRSQINAGQSLSVPERGEGLIFYEENSTEKLLLIWSAKECSELEVLKAWANPKDKGEIKDKQQIGALRDFLTKHSTTTPQEQINVATKQTTLKSPGEILVKIIKLEHRKNTKNSFQFSVFSFQRYLPS